MKNIFSTINPPGKHAILSALTLCLFLFLVVRCGLYVEQNSALTAENEELSAALADRAQTILDNAEEIKNLQNQLLKAASIEEYETETGFIKKGGVYLIDEPDQLWTLLQLIAEDMEIEPGVPAASASYRLRQDLNLNRDPGYEKLFCLGTEENPFCGSFDGDGKKIYGYFPPINADAHAPEFLFHADSNAQIENLSVINRTDEMPETGIHPSISRPWQRKELERHLPDFPDCSVQLDIYEWNPDTTQWAAELLRNHWDENTGQDAFSVSLTFRGDAIDDPVYSLRDETKAAYIQKIQAALCTLAGTEYTEIIEEALAEEEGYLWFVRLERIDELTCCTFEIGEPDFNPDTYGDTIDHYYVIVDGKQDGKEIPTQYFRIPYTNNEWHTVGVASHFRIEHVDIDFDGKQDLLIHEGFSGGSGGSWSNYRALVWRDTPGQFAYYPSFPSSAYKLEFDRERIVDRFRMGAGEEYIVIYEVVNGEYTRTRKLLSEESRDSEDNIVITLYYYEMDELMETHVLSDYDERETLYPDMNYWTEG